jgi:hypothetical protein
MEDTQFRQLLDRFGYSWAGYYRVRKGVKKRLARRMHEIRCRNIEEYIEAIAGEREERIQFECLSKSLILSLGRKTRLFFKKGKNPLQSHSLVGQEMHLILLEPEQIQIIIETTSTRSHHRHHGCPICHHEEVRRPP